MKTKKPFTWHSISINVDTETGEIIETRNALNNYIKIKTIKHATANQTSGLTVYTNEYRRSNQTKLF